ncbi:MAG: hypothetical protein ACI8X5_000871 [Planctomycetota bacterium]|jgi:hypothetical protein
MSCSRGPSELSRARKFISAVQVITHSNQATLHIGPPECEQKCQVRSTAKRLVWSAQPPVPANSRLVSTGAALATESALEASGS